MIYQTPDMTKSNEPKQWTTTTLVHWMKQKGYTINAPTISWDTQKSSKWYVYYMHVVLLDTTFFFFNILLLLLWLCYIKCVI